MTLTSVAGIAGAKQYGVAPYADLINVKIFDRHGREGTNAQVAQAVLDIIDEHKKNRAKTGEKFWTFRGSIINMSWVLGDKPTVLLHQLIKANEWGISVFAAAGNENQDAHRSYPCANVQTRCIAAVDNTYNKASWSNYGSVVDFIAPGKDIRKCTIR
jgi:cerevisin